MMTVVVTSEMIDKAHAGKREGHSFYNPIAMALVAEDPFVVVTQTAAHFSTKCLSSLYRGRVVPLPPSAAYWIQDFHRFRAVRPLRFEL
jgi:hypothetical protein